MPAMNAAWMAAVASGELYWELDQTPINGPNLRTITAAIQTRYPIKPVVHHPVMMRQARKLSSYAEVLYDEVYDVRQGLINIRDEDTTHVLMRIYLKDIITTLTVVMKIAKKLEDKAVVLTHGATCETASAEAVGDYDWAHRFFA